MAGTLLNDDLSDSTPVQSHSFPRIFCEANEAGSSSSTGIEPSGDSPEGGPMSPDRINFLLPSERCCHYGRDSTAPLDEAVRMLRHLFWWIEWPISDLVCGEL